jgi:catechol 2,3-dioxygenase-like lactoylglutathione lyase family enzyme
MTTNAIHPAVRVGHVHLRVSDLDRAIGFYRDALGLGLTADGREAGLDAAFLAAGDYHHHVGLNTWESAGGMPPPTGHTRAARPRGSDGLKHRALAVATDDVRRVGHPRDRRVGAAIGAFRAQLEAPQAVHAAIAAGKVRAAQPALSATRAFGTHPLLVTHHRHALR